MRVYEVVAQVVASAVILVTDIAVMATFIRLHLADSLGMSFHPTVPIRRLEEFLTTFASDNLDGFGSRNVNVIHIRYAPLVHDSSRPPALGSVAELALLRRPARIQHTSDAFAHRLASLELASIRCAGSASRSLVTLR